MGRTLRILMVDDSVSDVAQVKASLDAWHVPVALSVVENLADAEAFLDTALPHLMLVDFQQVADGEAELLAQFAEEPICPLLVMGREDERDVAERMIAAGATSYLVKTSETLASMAETLEKSLRDWQVEPESSVARLSEKQFGSIFASASSGMAIVGVDGAILQVNSALCELLGYSESELMQLMLKDITHPWDRPKTEKLYGELLAGHHKSLDYEKRYVRKDGSIVWGHPTVALSTDSEQTFLHFVAQVQDIGDRRKAEKELLAAHQKLQSIIEFLPDATFVIDREKNVTAWNREMEEKTGVRKEEILGQGDYAYAEALYGERKPTLIDLIGEYDLGTAAQYSYFEQKGEILFAERFMPTIYGGKGAFVWLKASPLYDPEGNLIGAIESIRDITDRKHAEQELRVAHRQMQDIIDFLPDATFVIDQRRQVVAWNRAMENMSGIGKDDMIGQSDHAYALPFYGERRPILIDLIGAPDLEKKAHYDVIGERGDMKYIEQYLPELYEGKGAYVWATASRLLDQDGNFAGAIESIRDISDRKQTEEKLKEANQELDAFVHTVSHDLRAPLTPIIGYAEHLRNSCQERLDEDVLSCLQEMERQGRRMSTLLEELLVFAQVGHIDEPSGAVELGEVVEEAMLGLGSQALEKGMKIEVKELPKLSVPRTQMFQVFTNLIGNALQYAGSEPGTIEVGGERLRKRARFYVRDHGPGVDAAERDEIFKLFVRGRRNQKSKGTGVGLAIVQKIAHRYGGRAWVEETPGGGATFWMEMADVMT
ncbi:MAG: hypothetical protein C0624_01855 [Desulfuromonas sp.]|nr:MAG: hypothetical protein C0624_01855 [Desulfuromonas sp.]